MRAQLHTKSFLVRPTVVSPQILDKSPVNCAANGGETSRIAGNAERLLVTRIGTGIESEREAGRGSSIIVAGFDEPGQKRRSSLSGTCKQAQFPAQELLPVDAHPEITRGSRIIPGWRRIREIAEHLGRIVIEPAAVVVQRHWTP